MKLGPNGKALVERISSILKSADSAETKSNAISAVIDKAAAEGDNEKEDDDKPPAESMTVNDVKQLLTEWQTKTLELMKDQYQGKKSVRSFPIEVNDAKLAGHHMGIRPMPIAERMLLEGREMLRAGIVGDKRDVLVMAQEEANHIYLASKMLQCDPREMEHYKSYRDTLKVVSRAMDEYTAGEGLEWVPTRWTGVLLERIRKELVVANLFGHITMTTKTEAFGIRGAKPVVYYLGNYPLSDNEAFIPASTPGTDDLTLTAKDLLARVLFAENFEEDAVFKVVPLIQEDLVLVCEEAIEDATISGDTAGALDTGYSYALSPRLAWDGLRKYVQSAQRFDVTTGSTGFTSTDLDAVRLLMGSIWGGNLRNLVWLTSFLGQMRISQFEEVQTLKDYGQSAVILNGEINRVKGVPIVVSQLYPQDLNASGVYDGVTTTYTTALAVARSAFIFGDRKNITIKTGDKIETGQRQLVLTWRGTFDRRYGSTETGIIGEAYKIN